MSSDISNDRYMFWLQIGPGMVLERANLNGAGRTVIHSSAELNTNSNLAIDRHLKMLFWLGIDGTIHRVDYLGRTSCKIHLIDCKASANCKPVLSVICFLRSETLESVVLDIRRFEIDLH